MKYRLFSAFCFLLSALAAAAQPMTLNDPVLLTDPVAIYTPSPLTYYTNWTDWTNLAGANPSFDGFADLNYEGAIGGSNYCKTVGPASYCMQPTTSGDGFFAMFGSIQALYTDDTNIVFKITGASAFGLTVWMDDDAGDPVGGSVRSIANGVLTNTISSFTNSQFIGWTASVGVTNVMIQLITSDAPAYLTFDNFYFSALPP